MNNHIESISLGLYTTIALFKCLLLRQMSVSWVECCWRFLLAVGREVTKAIMSDLVTVQRFEFAELNIRHTGNEQATINLVQRAIRLGYDSVVINIDVGELGAATTSNLVDDNAVSCFT